MARSAHLMFIITLNYQAGGKDRRIEGKKERDGESTIAGS